jgi:hypothetical protein
MSAHHRTAPAASGKPAKPYPDFPLSTHAAGVWAKKIKSKMHYGTPAPPVPNPRTDSTPGLVFITSRGLACARPMIVPLPKNPPSCCDRSASLAGRAWAFLHYGIHSAPVAGVGAGGIRRPDQGTTPCRVRPAAHNHGSGPQASAERDRPPIAIFGLPSAP